MLYIHIIIIYMTLTKTFCDSGGKRQCHGRFLLVFLFISSQQQKNQKTKKIKKHKTRKPKTNLGLSKLSTGMGWPASSSWATRRLWKRGLSLSLFSSCRCSLRVFVYTLIATRLTTPHDLTRLYAPRRIDVYKIRRMNDYKMTTDV